jgi:F-type H+-transporting ATPase subunit b
VLAAIDARERSIAAQLAEAAASKAEALGEREEFARRNEKFDQQRAQLLGEAVDAAESERRRLLEDARQAAEALSAKRQDMLREDFQVLQQAIAERARMEVFAIARKTLADLADASLEARIVEVFLQRLRALQGPDRAELALALQRGSAAAVVRSAFALTLEQQRSIRQEVEGISGAAVELRFETVPELIGGIELGTQGRKLAWSVADYLAMLEKSVGALLERPPGQETPAAAPTIPARERP